MLSNRIPSIALHDNRKNGNKNLKINYQLHCKYPVVGEGCKCSVQKERAAGYIQDKLRHLAL
jgi:hypothetical protein